MSLLCSNTGRSFMLMHVLFIYLYGEKVDEHDLA